MKKDIKVCVIGAGVCGLVSVKVCLESGFQVTCFDRSPNYGGLWNYCDLDNSFDAKGEFIPSVMRTTILNTSKELSAFSDFPPPAKTPNFMKHSLYMDYIRHYVEHFKLSSHLRLQHQVLQCKPEYDSDTDKITWLVHVKNLLDNKEFVLNFDKLMVAIGHHNIAHVPTFRNQHKFKGQIIHSAKIKDILTDSRFVDKRVLIVGLGNSACDAANDLAMVTNKCYVSCHRGNWFISRLTNTGLYDFEDKNRWNYYRAKFAPTSYIDNLIIERVESRTNHRLLGLTPQHKPSELVPAINDLFPYRIFTGGIILKSSIHNFTETGVTFEGEEDTEYPIDVVILATGYVARVPFLNEYQLGLKSIENNEYELYMNMFAPRLTLNGMEPGISAGVKSLAFIGLVQPSGSITVISEIQARYAALVFAGKRELPSVDKMIREIERIRTKRSISIRSHSKDQLVGNWMAYLDEVATKIGAKPNMSSLFFKDFALWKQLMFGPSVPYQYRLNGPGNWAKARETIMTVNDRIYNGFNEGKNHILFQTRRKSLKEEKIKSRK